MMVFMFQSVEISINVDVFHTQLSNRLRSSSMTDGVSDQALAPPLMVCLPILNSSLLPFFLLDF